MLKKLIVSLFVVSFTLFSASINSEVSQPLLADGIASWYGYEAPNLHTANGERWNPDGMTAAHRDLPFGTMVKVTDVITRKSVVVRVTDRGPAKWTGRVIDLARGAAKRLGIYHRGTGYVSLEVLPLEEAS